MGGPLTSAVAGLADRRVLPRLRDAGLLRPDPRRLSALAMAAPWLVGRGASLGLAAQIHGKGRPDRPAVVDRSGTLTWRELDGRANRAAAALDALGIPAGGRVALLLRNGREWLEVALATQKTNRVAAPLNTWATPSELAAVLGRLRPDVLFYDVRHSDQIRDAVGEGTLLVAVGDGDVPPGGRRYEALLAEQSDGAPGPWTSDRRRAGIVIQTSGTTGTPKGAQRDLGAKAFGAFVGLLATVPFRDDDVILCPAPLFHAFGLLTLSLATVLGCTLVLPDQFDPEAVLADIDRHGVTAASLVPVMIQRIVSLPPDVRGSHDLSTLRIVLASGSPLPQERRDAARAVFGDVVYDLYGSTEAGWIAVATPQDMRTRPATLGRPVTGVRVTVRGEDGAALPTGEHGEIAVSSPGVFEGYTGQGRGGDEIATGDIGWLDDDGHLYVGGRGDDMAVIGGENVYPGEVEAVVGAIDGVDDAAVVAVDDDEYGQVLAAFVVGSVEPDDVVSACRSVLAPYKVPRHVRVVDELPRTSSGKVRAVELRDAITAG